MFFSGIKVSALLASIWLFTFSTLLAEQHSATIEQVTNAASTQPIKVITANPRQTILRLNTPQPTVTNAKNSEYAELSVPGATLTSEAGYPALPYFSAWVAIPSTGDFTVNVKCSADRSLGQVKPAPFQPAGAVAGDVTTALYSGITSYPTQICHYGQPQIIRDFRVIQLNLYPVRYAGASNELFLIPEIEVTIDMLDQPGSNELAEQATYSSAFIPLYRSMICNFDQIRATRNSTGNSRILIVYGDYDNASYTSKLAEFTAWKRQKGFDVDLVSTAVTGHTNIEIKNYIRNQYDNIYTRPDFIILVGDAGGNFPIPAWAESFSGLGGPGDYPYTQLSGNDLLGDAFIGRLSAEYLTQLDIILAKIYAYEKTLNLTGNNAAWLNRMLLIGDTYSGISTVYVNHYIRELAERYNPDYSYIENYTGGYANTMTQGFNQGVGFFNYRGYLGLSGWTPGQQLVNGNKLPHSTILTCGTGTYDLGTSTTETLIRLGTPAVPAGAVTAIGIATTSTNTLFNNALTTGVYDGIFTYGMRTMGEALLNARLYIRKIYNGTQDDNATWFAHWTNLMGDPSLEVFTGIPSQFQLTVTPVVPLGTNFVDITVCNTTGNPVEDAVVTAYSNVMQNVISRAHTNPDGTATLYFNSPVGNDELLITCSKHDYKPLQQTVNVDLAGSLVYNNKQLYDNGVGSSIGNGDGYMGAGETLALKVELKNTTANLLSGIVGSLTSNSPYLELIDPQCSFPALNPGATGYSAGYLRLRILPSLPGGQNSLRLALQAMDANNTVYNIVFYIVAYNAGLEVLSSAVSSGNDTVPDPDEVGTLVVTLQNLSIVTVNDLSAVLISANDLLQVRDSLSIVGTVSAGGTAITLIPFGFWVRPQTVAGMQIPLAVRLFNDSGFNQMAYFNLTIGTVNTTTPTGPDAYGYLIYDDTDLGYPDAPVYDWVEINPALGGSGTLIDGFDDLGHTADEGDQVGSDVLETINLPFPFTYYGISYDRITVCVNGFIVFGETQCGEFRNYPMPGGYGPAKMVAAWWDDLIIIADAGIYQYYDSINHCFIIEYYKLRNGYNRTDQETFQVLLYDPVFYPTSLGDGKIKIQYQEFNNVDIGGNGDDAPEHGNYCTIGIKDHTNARGLQYSYCNQYTPASAPLGNQRAILITNLPVVYESAHLLFDEVVLNDTNANNIAEHGETLNLGFALTNIGLATATGVSVNVTIDSEYATLINNHSTYHDIATNATATNLTGITLTIDPNTPDNVIIPLIFNVTSNAGNWQFFYTLTVKKPQLYLDSYYINDTQGNANTLPEPGETCQLIVNIGNSGMVASSNVQAGLSCSYPLVTLANPALVSRDIPAQTIRQLVYDISILPAAASGADLPFTLILWADQITQQTSAFTISLNTPGISSGFENDNAGFLPTPLNVGWEWGISPLAGAHTGSRIWATRLNQYYPPNANWVLDSPQGGFAVAPEAYLSMWHKYNTQIGVDGGNVQISTDNGTSWIVLNPEGGYPSVPSALGEPGFSGNSNGWVLSRFDLNQWVNQFVRLRFHFQSDATIDGPGWFIDDLSTSGFVNFGGKVFGTVSSTNAALDYAGVYVSNNLHWFTNPAATGDYTLYMPLSSYDMACRAAGYATPEHQQVNITPTSISVERDFFLSYYAPVTNLNYSLGEDNLSISWNAPLQTEFPILDFGVYRKIDTGSYILCSTTAQEFYTQSWDEPGTHYSFYVLVNYGSGSSVAVDTVSFELPSDNAETTPPLIKTALLPNYPNPFQLSTTVVYSIGKQSPRDKGQTLKIRIFNTKGQLIKTLERGAKQSGLYSLIWDGNDAYGNQVASGIYFCRMDYGRYAATRKMMLLR